MADAMTFGASAGLTVFVSISRWRALRTIC
jgi:hypothetical protein